MKDCNSSQFIETFTGNGLDHVARLFRYHDVAKNFIYKKDCFHSILVVLCKLILCYKSELMV